MRSLPPRKPEPSARLSGPAPSRQEPVAKRNRLLALYLLIALLALTAAGCADPAADAPDAVVEEPAAEPAPAAMEPVAADVYGLSDDSTIGFTGSKVTGSHEGGFKSFKGTVSVAGGKVEGSSVEVTIDTTSLWADNDKLAGHLKGGDFFDVEAHPAASFTSTEIAAGEGGYTLTGNLDLHGVTKQISFPATIEVGDSGFAAKAEFSINRFDFGIVYAGRADDLIREEVLIKLDLRSASHGDAGDGAEEPEAKTAD